MAECICHQLASLRLDSAFNFEVGLVRPSECSQKLKFYLAELLALDPQAHRFEHGQVARHSKFAKCSRKDIVLVNGGAEGLLGAEVLAHVAIDGVAMSLVSLWSAKEINGGKGYAVWNRTLNLKLIETDFILEPCIYKVLGAEVLTFLPSRFR